MIKPLSLRKGSYKISPVYQSICLSVCLSVTHFYQDLRGGYFLHEDILSYLLKNEKARFWKVVFVV